MTQDPVIAEALSRDRLDGYAVAGGPNSDQDLLGRYLFNMTVSQALHSYFHTLEVVLRNRIYAVVAVDHSIDPARLDLYRDFPCWLDAQAPLLIPDHVTEVARAKTAVERALVKRYGPTLGRASRLKTPGRLVAQLPLSFWAYLFDKEYIGDRGNLGILWPRHFETVFPGCRVRNGVYSIGKRLRRLHVVRNRIMHFERIAPWEHYRDGPLDPYRVRGDILDLLAWMEPRTARALSDHTWDECFGEVYKRYLQWVARRV